MNNEVEVDFDLFLLADTNVAYTLFFFLGNGIIPSKNIIINDKPFKFHPIVLEEIETHLEAKNLFQTYSIGNREDYPEFLNKLSKEEIEKLNSFVEENTSNEVLYVESSSQRFFRKKRIYEAERLKIQAAWKSQGKIKGNKLTSKPSDSDYAVLLTAEAHNCFIVTNDEILLAVSEEFLEQDKSLKVEDIVNMLFKNDPSIEETIRIIHKTKLIKASRPFLIERALK